MSINVTCLRRPAARRLLLGSLALGAAATVAACSSSSPSTAAGSPGRATASPDGPFPRRAAGTHAALWIR